MLPLFYGSVHIAGRRYPNVLNSCHASIAASQLSWERLSVCLLAFPNTAVQSTLWLSSKQFV